MKPPSFDLKSHVQSRLGAQASVLFVRGHDRRKKWPQIEIEPKNEMFFELCVGG